MFGLDDLDEGVRFGNGWWIRFVRGCLFVCRGARRFLCVELGLAKRSDRRSQAWWPSALPNRSLFHRRYVVLLVSHFASLWYCCGEEVDE